MPESLFKGGSTSPEWWVNIKRNGGSTCSGIYSLNAHPEIKLVRAQREKLNILIRRIKDEVITDKELKTLSSDFINTNHNPHKVNNYIDEMAILLKDNYNNIRLSTAEKVKPKNLIKLINERLMTEKEEIVVRIDINKKKSIKVKNEPMPNNSSINKPIIKPDIEIEDIKGQYKNEKKLDASRDYYAPYREQGKYGSHPLHDDMGDEANP